MDIDIHDSVMYIFTGRISGIDIAGKAFCQDMFFSIIILLLYMLGIAIR